MKRPKRLTEAEARTLTRAQILDRLEAESDWWTLHRPKTDADREAYAVFSRLLHAYIDPAEGLKAAMDTLEGRSSDYWETRPGDPS